ncbi:MAG: septal ring lytic transglycosylase RlpA family protein [Methylococcales bacterium]|nr:septal ring lytic transglycosylase RlpA family protein [Methylococcales bacterium]MDD5631636.1 septal ring lytic transglycosylase RlpA family protein [Methylococcales bacterium]
MKLLTVLNVVVLMVDILGTLHLAAMFRRNGFSRLAKPLLISLLALPGCTYFNRPSEHFRPSPKTTKEYSKYQHKQVGKVGKASWYGPGFQGKRTASGEMFDQNKLTAGSLNLPLGTVVEVTNLKNNRKVELKINDRGPYVKGRSLDLSRAAADKLGMVSTGVAPVKIKVKSKPALHKRYTHRKHRR